MTCGSRFYEDNPVRDRERDTAAAEKNEAAAKKIAQVFENVVGPAQVRWSKEGEHGGPTKILLTPGERLLVRHRGYTIAVLTQGNTQVLEQFKAWREQNMSHARIVT